MTTPDSNRLSRPDTSRLLDALSGDAFNSWYRSRQFRANIQNGQPYFNGSGTRTEARRHTPSRLLKCQRKQFYSARNAPKESEGPRGIFWFGTEFEERIVVPFLESITAEVGGYVRNSDWVDYTVSTNGVDLQFKGETDPMIVDDDATPLLPLEVKTRSSVGNLDTPSQTHKAQLHAYLAGLSRKYDTRVLDGVILYGDRSSFDVKCFHVPFDDDFWNGTVLPWAAAQTRFRADDILPPDRPEQSWECGYCPYKERCGQGDTVVSDMPARGFVPGLTSYPRENVESYLQFDSEAELTSALAVEYPDLGTKYPVKHWCCPRCGAMVSWDDLSTKTEPLCPDCADDDVLTPLTPPFLEMD